MPVRFLLHKSIPMYMFMLRILIYKTFVAEVIHYIMKIVITFIHIS